MKTLLVLCGIITMITSHGRLMQPAGRSSIWRVPSFQAQNPPQNQQDDGLSCGGRLQATHPGTDCGVCGDPPQEAQPRSNEIGGTYDKGIITGKYRSGQVIETQVDITYFHKGFMEWRLCENATQETQTCFDKNVLQMANGFGSRLLVRGTGTHKALLKLPDGIRCDRCVIQWIYRGGDVQHRYGPQRNYRSCADISIS